MIYLKELKRSLRRQVQLSVKISYSYKINYKLFFVMIFHIFTITVVNFQQRKKLEAILEVSSFGFKNARGT